MTGLKKVHALNAGVSQGGVSAEETLAGGANRAIAVPKARRFGLSLSTCALLLGGSIIATSVADVAHAQDAAGEVDETQTPVSDETDDNVIIVSGIRQSLANAQDIKKNADTIVDAITSDDIGSLPDRSINEALQRVPGVAITRFASPSDSAHFSVQGSGVTIRGLNYVRSEFNGRDAFSADGGRSLGFDSVPAELAGTVEVYKNLTADMIEGGIAGTVSINSRKPFDSADQVIFASVGANYGDLAQELAPSFVGLYSNQWELGDGSRIGVLVGGSYSKQFSRADSIFLNGFQPRFNAPCPDGRIINEGEPYALRVCDEFPTPAGYDQVYTPLGAGFRSQDFERERNSINTALQFENASGNLLVTAEYIRSEFNERWTERTIESDNWFPDAGQIFPAGYLNQPGFVYDPDANFMYDENGIFTSGTLVHSGGGDTGLCQGSSTDWCNYDQFIPGGIFTKLSNRSAFNDVKAQDASINVQWSPTDRLHIQLDGQYIKSDVRNADDAINFNTLTNVSIDLTGQYPDVNFVTPGFDTATYIGSGNATYYRSAVENRAINEGDEYALRADLSYDLSEDSFLREVRGGARYAKRKQTVRTNEFNNWGGLSETWIEGGPVFVSSDPSVVDYYDYPDFFHGEVGAPPGALFVKDSILEERGALIDLASSIAPPGYFTPIEDRGTDLIEGYFLPGEVFPNSEETLAAYLSGSFGADLANGMKISGNVGIRYVHTTDESSGAVNFAPSSQVIPDAFGGDFDAYCAGFAGSPGGQVPALCQPGVTAAQQQAALDFANGASVPDVAKNSFDHWLPSLNVRLDASDELVFRFAASKAISRPDFANLRNYVGLTYNGQTGGFTARSLNPFLKPVEAWQFDLTAEWYFAPVGSLTLSMFYKNIDNIVVSNQVYSRDLTNNGVTLPVSVSGPANTTGSTKIKGAELAYQQTFDFLPGALSGFGTQLSYTYIDVGSIVIGPPAYAPSNDLTETGNQPTIDITGLYENLPLEGLSKHNFNAALFYERGPIQARVAYSWRSRFLLTRLDCCFPFGPVYQEPSGQVDASIGFDISDRFRIVGEVQNLLDTTLKTSFVLNADGLRAPRSWFKNDRQFALSARVKF